MSRAINIDAPQDDVQQACVKHGAGISSIETLPGGCTRLVLQSADAAVAIRKLYGNKVVTTTQVRTPLQLASRGVPMTQDIVGRSSGFAVQDDREKRPFATPGRSTGLGSTVRTPLR
ncbi:hypothetical protein [Sphingomonas montanisoli]|uniref:Uncharacterized protein n=1 Tax=Sphingomonas montanisoli TaxID=2606412 RepID=A0A5D9BX36_9SPHN|nr:hypothetical protein [Sphingomonas montanisoli]TZG24138.1 hypothetical protein FYJ91_20100 [Sphingomonas montanisoli]